MGAARRRCLAGRPGQGAHHPSLSFGRLTLPCALAEGMAAVRERIANGLTEDPRIRDTGLGLIDVRVVAVRAELDVERALQTPMREEVQQEADVQLRPSTA